jgi:uncharacterized FAD-dependent dehydrogenase
VDFPEGELSARVLSIIRAPRGELAAFSVVRRGFDARRKGEVRRVYAAELSLRTPSLERKVLSAFPGARPVDPPADPFPRGGPFSLPLRPVVVGCGPAGLFAAWTLARFGLPPLLLERGRPVEERARHAAALWTKGILDPESNPQFGEGGAGAFSDGKLTTRIGDPLVSHVLSLFEELSGLPGLSREAKPHVGTDRLRRFLVAMRGRLLALGTEIRFGARVDGLLSRDGAAAALRLSTGEEVPCRQAILAVGHSARDTLRSLAGAGLPFRPKPFAVGFRIELPQAEVDRIQYGRMAGHPALPAADFRVAVRAPSGRGVWSFCMCPGGAVLAAPSEAGRLAVNGMSGSGRSSGFANSGMVAAVGPADYGGGLFAGMEFQREIEARAFAAGGGGFAVPACSLPDFLAGAAPRSPLSRGRVLAPAVRPADLSALLPPAVTADLREGLARAAAILRGFGGEAATLYAVESRTSSPLQAERDDSCESAAVRGVYPVGEGAGHAGGIVSAAVDGVRAALSVLRRANPAPFEKS